MRARSDDKSDRHTLAAMLLSLLLIGLTLALPAIDCFHHSQGSDHDNACALCARLGQSAWLVGQIIMPGHETEVVRAPEVRHTPPSFIATNAIRSRAPPESITL